jgi:D-beta-D-heptose 7-phosphate kinase/D-beta-D-heptose 1-phosphate adenosyltransferase
VAANLKAVGADPVLVGSFQRDAAGLRLTGLLEGMGIQSRWLVENADRPTIIKTRVIGQQQQMLRIDREDTEPLSGEAVDGLARGLEAALDGAGALIISDYAKGSVCLPVMERVRSLCRERGIPWIVDPKPAHAPLYRGATLMTPNTKELGELSRMPAKSEGDVAAAGRALVSELALSGLLVTRSDKGMALFAAETPHPEPWFIPTEAREVFDVSGAGDTVIAVFSAAVATGADWKEAAMLANAAAGVVVGKMGTATATPEEILRHYQDQKAI